MKSSTEDQFEVIRHAISRAETLEDGELLYKVVDALAAQALGRCELLLEQFGIDSIANESKVTQDSVQDDQ